MKTPNTRLQKCLAAASWLVLAALFLFVALRWASLPERLPMHYNFAGEIDRWGNRWEVFLCPFIGLGMFVIFSVVLRVPSLWNMVVQPTEANQEKLYSITKTLLLLMRLEMLGIFFYLTVATTTLAPLSVWFLPVVLVVVFGTLGVYFCQQVQVGKASRRVICIDSEVTRLKKTFPVSKWWLLGPLFLTVVPFLYLLTSPSKGGWLYALLLAGEVLPFCVCYFAAAREKSTFFTGDARRNMALNRLQMRRWTGFWVLVAYNAAIAGLLCFSLLQAGGFRLTWLVVVIYFAHVFLAVGFAFFLRHRTSQIMALLLEGAPAQEEPEAIL